jgi:hypothetical protein
MCNTYTTWAILCGETVLLGLSFIEKMVYLCPMIIEVFRMHTQSEHWHENKELTGDFICCSHILPEESFTSPNK